VTPVVFDLELLGASRLSAIAEIIADEWGVRSKLSPKETDELAELILKRIQRYFLPVNKSRLG